MKYSKRYLFFFALLLIALAIKYDPPAAGSEEIRSFRGANLDSEVWNPLIASSVNDNLLSVVIDNREYTNEEYPFYMDDQLSIMVPVTVLRDAMNCSAHLYNGKRLLVEKHSSGI